uniref:BTB domain-containing protein n=1 Tax=Guillardia theta TaxID=55529 RepID=A0A7S4NZY5_GUITH
MVTKFTETMAGRLTCYVTGGWFQHARKIELEPAPENLTALKEALSSVLKERVGRVYYLDAKIKFLVELERISDLQDPCKLQVERWEPSGAALKRLEARVGSGWESELAEVGKQCIDSESGSSGKEGRERDAGTGNVRGLACGPSSGWNYVDVDSLGPIVSLNVGGRLFTASKDTLMRVKDSYLAGILMGRLPVSRDKEGNIFIDRDPKKFKLILSYLRDDILAVPRDPIKSGELLLEARFFQLAELERIIQDAWTQTCVLTFFTDISTGLVHTVHVDGPTDVIKSIRAAVAEEVSMEHLSYSLDGTLLTLNLDGSHGGVEVSSHGLGGWNHSSSLLQALLAQGWELCHQDLCGGVGDMAGSGLRKDARSPLGVKQENSWERSAVSRALGGTLLSKISEPVVEASGGRRRESLVSRIILKR